MVYNIYGVLVNKTRAILGLNSIFTNNLSDGLYIVKVENNGNDIHTEKVIYQ